MLILIATLGLIASGAAGAQPQPDPAKPAQALAPSTPPATVPSLDELLGTKSDKPATPTPSPAPAPASNPDAAPQPTTTIPPEPGRADLDRLLSGEEIGEAFKQAVSLMGDAAKRLETAKDTGLDTQRVQEDVVRRLDQLLASMQRQPSSSSSSSSSQQQQQEKQQNKNQPNQKKPGGKQNQQQMQNGDGNRDWDGPPKQEGALKPALDSARAAWGALPARVRDMLMQGSEDTFSARYKALTEAYYRRLAEEKK